MIAIHCKFLACGWAISLASLASPALAKPGEPIAIRVLPGGSVEITSMWNLSVVIHADQVESSSAQGVDVLLPGVKVTQQSRSEDRLLANPDATEPIDHVLDRPANQSKPTWQPFDDAAARSENAIRVRTFPDSRIVIVNVDGVGIAYWPLDDSELPNDPIASQAILSLPVLVVTIDDSKSELIKALEERSKEGGNKIIVAATKSLPTAVGNTVAVSENRRRGPDDPSLVVLSRKPPELGDELQQLIAVKERACEASQDVFAQLSVNQMNFRPGNGTHTPRWNTEHMMGRELLFFSQIFAELDPAIPVIDLNPKQMPPDYQARHADWTGAEEARQMERVSAFTSRFAYLLKNVPLDEKAPGSNWTLRGLLRQMDRHYSEHTANVEKKFELADWPQE